MILQSLVTHYEILGKLGKVPRLGWCRAKVSYALEISEAGELIRIYPLKTEEVRGKKTVQVPANLQVPFMLSRASGVLANFLCDHSGYFLGIDNKGKPDRSLQCFEAEKEKHLEVLEKCSSKAAVAVKGFFENWDPGKAAEHEVLSELLEEIITGGNLVFQVRGQYVHEDAEVITAWDTYYNRADGLEGRCLVTGRYGEIARTHGTLQGVQGAQSSGAALVSFNAPAFESYGKEQSYNAPVSSYAVYAYSTALSYLLADRDHTSTIGDATIAYWSEDGESEYQDLFAAMVEPVVENYQVINGLFKNLESMNSFYLEDAETKISLEQPFYILGLSPNAARISVRFFYQNTYGAILKNIKEHHDRMEIVNSGSDVRAYLGIWRMLQETVNKKSRDKKPVPNMAGALYRSIISGSRYPAALYTAVLNRIRADQDDKDVRIYKITSGRAAIIKAYLLRNGSIDKEEITVALNETSKNLAYVLGREFAILEAIQMDANPGINSTIKDRYFNSACATPAVIFPVLFKLKNSHIRKLKDGWRINYEKELQKLQDKISFDEGVQNALPKRLSLEEQGMFILGYYHQMQKKYEKKNEEEQ